MVKSISGLTGICLFVALSGCPANAQTQTLNQINVILQQINLCLTQTANSGKYEALKPHTNLENPRLISGAMATDKRYATMEEIALIKQRHEELEPCKRKVFEGFVSIFPDLQLLLIKTEIEGEKNTKSLIERKITWGQYNQNILNLVEQGRAELQPVIQRIQNNVALEKQQEIAAQQQVLDALSTLADIVLDIKFHTGRSLHRSGGVQLLHGDDRKPPSRSPESAR